MGDTAVSWRSYKLSDVSRSTPEAEYCACSDTAAEARDLTNLLTELGFAPELPIKIPTDNQGAQAMIENTTNRRLTKHIVICYHFVLDYFRKGFVTFPCVISSITPIILLSECHV